MLNRSASLAMSTSLLKVLPGKLDNHLVFSIYDIVLCAMCVPCLVLISLPHGEPVVVTLQGHISLF